MLENDYSLGSVLARPDAVAEALARLPLDGRSFKFRMRNAACPVDGEQGTARGRRALGEAFAGASSEDLHKVSVKLMVSVTSVNGEGSTTIFSTDVPTDHRTNPPPTPHHPTKRPSTRVAISSSVRMMGTTMGSSWAIWARPMATSGPSATATFSSRSLRYCTFRTPRTMSGTSELEQSSYIPHTACSSLPPDSPYEPPLTTPYLSPSHSPLVSRTQEA